MIVYPHFVKITRTAKMSGKVYSKWEEMINMPYPEAYTLDKFEHYTQGKWLIVKLPSGDARWDLTKPYDTEPERTRVEEEMAKIVIPVEPEQAVSMEPEVMVTYEVETAVRKPRRFEVRDLLSNKLLAGNMAKGEADRAFKELSQQTTRKLRLKEERQ